MSGSILNCRDEIIPILRALQQVYSQPQLRDEILDLVAQDVNDSSRTDRGREGLDYWQILVLASVRLGCNLDYDKLQDLAEQHRALRQIMGVGDWDEDINFSWRRIRDNVSLVKWETIEKVSHLIVSEGHRLEPDAVKKVRVDSFVVETNIHYPTESSLIVDGTRKVIELCILLSATFGINGWASVGPPAEEGQTDGSPDQPHRFSKGEELSKATETTVSETPATHGEIIKPRERTVRNA